MNRVGRVPDHGPSGLPRPNDLPGGKSLAEPTGRDHFEFSIATTPPTLRQRQLTLATAAVFAYRLLELSSAFAATQLVRIDSFVPVVQGHNNAH